MFDKDWFNNLIRVFSTICSNAMCITEAINYT